MRQRELLDFRTPQHPSLGTNHWGGASPLLARNIPKESLEQRYLNLNATRTRDEIFPAEDRFKILPTTFEPAATRSQGFFSRLRLHRKEKVELGSDVKKKRWFPRWDSRNRWPQGWG